jgi:starvation-inducible outer membrane lipoprotein
MQTRWLILAGILVLSGCVAPQKLQKTRTDISTYSEQQRQRATIERCADAGAMPGTTAELECRMGLGGTAPEPAPAH